MRNFLLVALVIIFLCSENSFAQEDKTAQIHAAVKRLDEKNLPVSFEARYFNISADGNLNTANYNVQGGELNLKRDLNLIDDKAPELILRYKNFSVDWLRMTERGGNFSGSNLTFGGANFSDSIPAKNSLHYVKVNVDNEIISLMGTGANWSYGLTGIFFRGSAQTSGKNYFIAVPTVGLGIYMAIMPKMTIYSQVSGIFLGGRGHLHDFESGVKYSPSKNFTLSAGFRSVEFNFNRKGNGDFKMNGPFIGLRTDF